MVAERQELVDRLQVLKKLARFIESKVARGATWGEVPDVRPDFIDEMVDRAANQIESDQHLRAVVDQLRGQRAIDAAVLAEFNASPGVHLYRASAIVASVREPLEAQARRMIAAAIEEATHSG
jgi:hypothetical protein